MLKNTLYYINIFLGSVSTRYYSHSANFRVRYSQKSIGDFLLWQQDASGAMVEFVCHEFAVMDPGQKVLSAVTLVIP